MVPAHRLSKSPAFYVYLGRVVLLRLKLGVGQSPADALLRWSNEDARLPTYQNRTMRKQHKPTHLKY